MDTQLLKENQILNEKLAYTLKQIKQQDADLQCHRQNTIQLQQKLTSDKKLSNQLQQEFQNTLDNTTQNYDLKINNLNQQIQIFTQKLKSETQFSLQIQQNSQLETKKINSVLQEIYLSLHETCELALPGMPGSNIQLDASSDPQLNEVLEKITSVTSQIKLSIKAFKEGNKLIREKLRNENKCYKVDIEVEKKKKTEILQTCEEYKQKMFQLENEVLRLKNENDSLLSQNNEYQLMNNELTIQKEQFYKDCYQNKIIIQQLQDEDKITQLKVSELESRTKNTENMIGRFKAENDQLKQENHLLEENLKVFIQVEPELELDREQLVKMATEIEDEGLEEYLAKQLLQIV
ncbi:hypothetical protein SS50377_27489 [Spironucleus salmonicida]|uniref:Uncharacterized protein n=1 Tax=Spironucleus salmonicida TaxID=348837 RepID=V6LQG8_9EUKA|nr:hypothetical protein SS50377_27489 [Spironucleus salmonicida]|eukprot:EST46917.1 Hypothetical protein SS50377_13073 [Spironucleus salmonicida]